MKSLPENRLLKLPSGAVENIRKIHNLDKPERLEEAIKILDDWIQKQDHIIKKDFTKEYLDKTLISCKGSVEKAKQKIDRLCTMKTLLPKFFSKSNPKLELQIFLDIACLCPLPIITKDYYRVLMLKVRNKKYTSETFMQYYQYLIILVEYIKAHDYVDGFIIINDYSETNMFDFMSKINTVELQQFISIIIECYCARIKGIHLITESKAIQLLVKTMKQILSEKLGNRIYVHQTHDDLHKIVPKEILPAEYGGNERSLEKLQEEWIDELCSEKHMEYMKMMSKAGTDETKRHAAKFNEEYMGMPGAFRNLSVD